MVKAQSANIFDPGAVPTTSLLIGVNNDANPCRKAGLPMDAFPTGNAGGSRPGRFNLLPLEEKSDAEPPQVLAHARPLLSLAWAWLSPPLLADELFGVITKADADAKKITVVEKDTDKEIEVKITDDTEYVAGKGTGKVDFEKLEKGIERAKEKGRKGIAVKITHEKGVASKIVVEKKEEEGRVSTTSR